MQWSQSQLKLSLIRSVDCAAWQLKLLKTERNLLYIRNQSYRAVNTFHHGYKTNQLMMYTSKVAVYSDTPKKYSTKANTM
jgi:hypothetical protein